MATKRPFKRDYPQYNPAVEGFGNPTEWKQAFSARMGTELAIKVLGGMSPYDVLGCQFGDSMATIKKAHRAKVFEVHPDRMAFTGMTKEDAEAAFKRVQAAYELLEDRLAA